MGNQTSQGPFTGLDVRGQCRNWFTEAGTGTIKRMFCRAWPLRAIATGINHLLGQHPRLYFAQAQSTTTAYSGSTSGNPLYRWRYNDTVANGTVRVVRFLALPRVNGTGNAYVGVSDGDGNEYATSSFANMKPASVTYPDDLFYGEFSVSARPQSGAAPGSDAVKNIEVIDGLRVYNGFTMMDVVVEDKELDTLIDGTHTLVDPSKAKQHGWCKADIAEDIRDGNHEARRGNPGMAVLWCARTVAGSWGTPTTSDHTGIVVDAGVVGGATYVNVFDQSITTRDTDTIGISTHGQYCGIGDATQTNGQKITVVCQALAAIQTGVTLAKIKFIGPDHLANNNTEITVSATSATWVGGTGTIVYLNPASADSDANTSRNKIDIHAKCTAGGGNSKLYIYALRGYILYPADLW